MPYDNFKKQEPRYWREAEMLALLESKMNNATSLTELAMWFEFAKSLSKTVKGFFGKLIKCKDENKLRLAQSDANDFLLGKLDWERYERERNERQAMIPATIPDGYTHGGYKWRKDLNMWEHVGEEGSNGEK
jgi:hypothetical protein